MERRFRTTVWPGTIPAVSKVETLGPYQLRGDLLVLDLAEAHMRTVVIPNELYLREVADIDLDNPAAILAFTNTYGRLGHVHGTSPRNWIASHEPNTPVLDRQLIRILGVDVPDERKLDAEAWRDEVTNHSSAQHWGAVEERLILDDGMQHIDSFRAWVKAFRIMTKTYDRYMELQADDSDVVHLTSILTELLSPFSPTIQVRYKHDLDEHFDPFENTYPRLESILALQMYHHIAAEDSYQPCQNKPCGRLFVHQRGRAEHGQYRGSGLKYCSKNCAKAQVERERRRRNRQRDKEQDTN